MTTVFTVKLINGEEFLTTIDSKDSKQTVFNKPMVLMNTGQGFQLIPWMVTLADDYVSLENKNILFVGEAQEEISEGYLEATGQRTIQTPKKGIVLPN